MSTSRNANSGGDGHPARMFAPTGKEKLDSKTRPHTSWQRQRPMTSQARISQSTTIDGNVDDFASEMISSVSLQTPPTSTSPKQQGTKVSSPPMLPAIPQRVIVRPGTAPAMFHAGTRRAQHEAYKQKRAQEVRHMQDRLAQQRVKNELEQMAKVCCVLRTCLRRISADVL